MRPPRVLHVVETWPPLATGYASRSALIVRHQAAQGIARPAVLVSSRQHTFAGGRTEPLAEVVPLSPRERFSRRWRAYDLDAAHLRRAVERRAADADIVHAHFSSGLGRAAAEAAKASGKPFVAEVRFDLAGAMTAQTLRGIGMLEPLLRRHFEAHLRKADAVVAASHALGRMLGADGLVDPDRLTVVANGAELAAADPARIAAVRGRLGLAGATTIGTTSAMLAYEGLDRLIRAAVGLPVVLLLVGDGPERRRLEALARALGVRAVFTGAVPRCEVAAHLGAIDIFAVPRRDLSVTAFASPLKVSEAMAAGSAIVASAVGDIPRMLDQERGLLVPAGDDDALREALAGLAADPARRQAMGRRAECHARTRMSWAGSIARYRDVYARLT